MKKTILKIYNSKYFPVVFSMLVSLIYVIPFLILSNRELYGDDLHFHINRVHSLSNVFRSPINFEAWQNRGSGINIFYPWLTFYPFFILSKVFRSVYFGWYAYVFVITILSTYICYVSGKGILKSKKGAILFSILYIFSTYRLINLFVRFATGEFIAMSFIPLAIYGLYKIFFDRKSGYFTLALAMTGIMYSHLLSVLMTSLILAITFICFVIQTKKVVQPLIDSLRAVVVTISLSTFQIAPMLEQFSQLKLWTPPSAAPDFSGRLLNISQILLNGLNNDLKSYTIGPVFVTLIILIVFNFNKIKGLNKTWVFLAGLCLLAMTPLMPYNFLEILNLEVIQYTFRWSVFITLFVALIISRLLECTKFKQLVVILFFMMTIHFLTINQYLTLVRSAPPATVQELTVRNPMELLMNYRLLDYSNEISDKINVESAKNATFYHRVYSDMIEVPSTYKATANNITYNFTTNKSRSTVYIPVYYYLGQEVFDNGNKIESKVSDWGNTEVELTAGVHTIDVTYHYTLLAKISALISGSTAIVLFIFYYLKRLKISSFKN